MADYRCRHCKKDLEASDAYEYRGVISFAEHFDDVIKDRESERAAIIEEESEKVDEQREEVDRRMGGLSKRELIAAMAMQGILSRSGWSDAPEVEKMFAAMIARKSFIHADALLAELTKERTDE